MTAHLSNEIVERFHAQALAEGDRAVIYDHILACELCRLLVVDSQTEAVALRTLSEHLLPREGDEPYHLDYETIEAFVDERLDAIDRGTAKLHLEECAECLADVTDLRESLVTIRSTSVAQLGRRATIRDRLLSLAKLPTLSTPLRVSAVSGLIGLAVIAGIFIWRLKMGSDQFPVRKEVTAGSQPTPFNTPQRNRPDITPSPSLGEPPTKLAENKPIKDSTESRPYAVALNDGKNQVALDMNGNLIGLESAPRESQQAVKEALSGQTIKRPDVLDEVTRTEGSLRAPNGNEERIVVIYPANTVVAQNRPILRWVPSKTAQAYRVEIGDAGFHQVAKSEDLPAATLTWTPTAPLKRGIVYTWTIRAINTQGETTSMTSRGKFKILEDEKAKELNRLKAASKSHLALGVFYAREGMISEAKREFQILATENPGSSFAKKILKEIDSWQKR